MITRAARDEHSPGRLGLERNAKVISSQVRRDGARQRAHSHSVGSVSRFGFESYATQYGSATAEVDYDYREERITFAPGETTKTRHRCRHRRHRPRGRRELLRPAYDPGGGVLGDRWAAGTIVNDDSPPAP